LFWRLWLRALTVRRPQAAVAIVSLLVGAAVMSMLVNLYSGTRRAMTEEFRAYGANAVLAPPDGALLGRDVLERLAAWRERVPGLVAVPRLDVVARIEARSEPDGGGRGAASPVNAVAVGTDFRGLLSLNRAWRVLGSGRALESGTCVVGERAAERLHLKVGDAVQVEPLAAPFRSASFTVANVLSTGASEDDQVFLPLEALERLAGMEGNDGGKGAISLVELSVPGEPREVERAVQALSADFARPSGGAPGAEVRPVRQIVESEGRVLSTLRGLVVWLTVLILTIIALCVMATMTAIVLERRKDIAVMKALGAGDRLVMRLFLAEGASLGLVGGAIGVLVGALLARGIGQRLFGVSLDITWWTLPLVSLTTMGLATLATFFPVRIVRRVVPAAVLKGE
jgi:putative ABC transport system permease protein